MRSHADGAPGMCDRSILNEHCTSRHVQASVAHTATAIRRTSQPNCMFKRRGTVRTTELLLLANHDRHADRCRSHGAAAHPVPLALRQEGYRIRKEAHKAHVSSLTET